MRPWLAIGGLVMIGIAIALAFGGWGGFLRPATVADTTDTVAGVRKIELDTDSGDVNVRSADVGDVRVQRKLHYRGDKPGRTFANSDGTLRLSGCGTFCSVDYTVLVPRGVDVGGHVRSGEVFLGGVRGVDVEARSGDVRVTDSQNVHVDSRSGSVSVDKVNGPVRVETNSGDASLRDVQGSAQVKANSGTVDVNGLRGSLDAEAKSGDINAQLAVASDVKARANSGNVAVSVPRGADYRVVAETSGDKNLGVPNSSTAAHELDVTASSGDVTLRAN